MANKQIYTLSEKKVAGAISCPIIKTKYLSVNFNDEISTTVFTSKNGVKGLYKIRPDFINYPSFVIGEETAKEIILLGGRVLFIATKSNGEEFAKELQKHNVSELIWARGMQIAYDLTKTANLNIKEVVVYETICNDSISFSFDSNSAIVFSSPSTVKCFFSKDLWRNDLMAIAIGATTANALKEYGVDAFVSPQQTLKSAVELATKVLQNQS